VPLWATFRIGLTVLKATHSSGHFSGFLSYARCINHYQAQGQACTYRGFVLRESERLSTLWDTLGILRRYFQKEPSGDALQPLRMHSVDQTKKAMDRRDSNLVRAGAQYGDAARRSKYRAG
jgi:hypothetical protein